MQCLNRKQLVSGFLFTVLVFGSSGCAMFTVKDSGTVMRAENSDIIMTKASTERGENASEKAFDGEKGTKWESIHGVEKAWLIWKFKPGKTVETLKIFWDRACASEYELKVSEDGKRWQTIAAVFDGSESEERNLKFAPAQQGYMGIFCQKRSGDLGYSISDVIINPLVLLPEERAGFITSETTAASERDGGKAVSAADSDMNTRWESHQGIDPQWLAVKLDTAQKIRAVKVFWERASAKKYDIETSMDGRNWKTAARITDGKESEERIITFAPVEAQFVRVFGRSRNGEWGYSIFEVEVYR